MFRSYINKKRISAIKRKLRRCGKGVYIDAGTVITFAEKVEIDDYVHIQPQCCFFGGGGLSIGKGSVFAHEVQIFTQNHNYNSEDLEFLPYDTVQVSRPVVIGEYVWVGARATILPGVTVGEGAVIGAGSVVAGDVPPMAVVGGNPAKVIKYRDKDIYNNLKNKDAGYIKNCKREV